MPTHVPACRQAAGRAVRRRGTRRKESSPRLVLAPAARSVLWDNALHTEPSRAQTSLLLDGAGHNERNRPNSSPYLATFLSPPWSEHPRDGR